MQKKVPMRMCVVCRQSKPKSELIRIVKTEDSGVAVDEVGKAPGRGAYICADIVCIDRARGPKALLRSMRAVLNDEQYEKLKGIAERRAL